MHISESSIQQLRQNNYIDATLDSTLIKIIKEHDVFCPEIKDPRCLFQRAVKHIIPENPICLEVGVQQGHNAARLLETLHPSKLFLLDKSFGSEFPVPIVKKAIQADICIPITTKSDDTSWVEPGMLFDFIYIDACHRHPYIDQDIQAWLPFVKPGGVIGGHDYSIGYYDVIEAVDEAYKNNNNLKPLPYRFECTTVTKSRLWSFLDLATHEPLVCVDEWAFIKV